MGGRNQDAAINGRGDGQTDFEVEIVFQIAPEVAFLLNLAIKHLNREKPGIISVQL